MSGLTILTAVKNAELVILPLINSLNSQTSDNFEWLIVDGISTDDTVQIIKNHCHCNYRIISQPDFSIYHALNIGVLNLKSDYYCVAGGDDIFAKDFVEYVNNVIREGYYDLIFGSIKSNGKIYTSELRFTTISPVNASHSIGTVIKKSLHNTVGLYSNMYTIIADKKFVIDALKTTKSVYYSSKILGEYSQSGFSSVNSIDYVCDLFKLQIKNGYNFYIQFMLLLFRIVKIKILK